MKLIFTILSSANPDPSELPIHIHLLQEYHWILFFGGVGLILPISVELADIKENRLHLPPER